MSSEPGDAEDRRDTEDRDVVDDPVESDWQRRRRIAEVFGDVLPDTTGDERSSGTPRRDGAEGSGDRWLREQVPPHHGG